MFCDVISQSKADVVVGLEARGFTFGGAVCYKLKLPFVPIRKKNKLPGSVNTENYNKSYGEVINENQFINFHFEYSIFSTRIHFKFKSMIQLKLDKMLF